MLSLLSILLICAFLIPQKSVALLGEPEDALDTTASGHDNNKDYYQLLALKAVSHLNSDSNDMYHWKLEKLMSAKRQVIAGLKYKLKFVVARSECRKEGDDEKVALNLCSVRDDAPKQVCHYEVLLREWENTEEFVNRGCSRQHTETKGVNSKSHVHPLRHHEEENAVSKNAANLLKVGRSIKAKDFGAWNLFSGFIDRYSKIYDSKREILKRFRIYKHNVRAAKMWQDNEHGTAIYGETQFMDLTPEEFRNTYLPYKWTQPKYHVRKVQDSELELEDENPFPTSVDWRKEGVVTDVKNQQACGSCWAFSVTGNIEGQWARKTGKLVSLLQWGLPLNAYKEIIRIGGLEPESAYPYDAHRETCHLARKEIAVYINDSVQLPQDEGKMAVWLFKNGPISIGINAYPLQFYRHGISHPWKVFCSPLMLNHGVLIVGYGQEGNKPFWIIKNSWGTGWGENGYYRLYRGKNVCGVNEMATSSIID
uniref:Uncharacterized protein n=1 Tax=Ditylenchus dipsaci TaxID=166011 RepID=A0A915ERG2_9BILA